MSLPPPLPPSPRIVVAFVTDAGEAAKVTAGEQNKSFHWRILRATGKNTICVYVNEDHQTIVGIKILGSDFRERHGEPVFFGDHLKKYNNCEADIAWSRTFNPPLPLSDVGRQCGVPAYDKVNNVSWTSRDSFCRPWVSCANSTEVLRRYKKLVMTWITA